MTMTRTVGIALGVASIVLAAVPAPDAAATDRSVVLAVGGRANATPSIAAEGQLVVVAWSADARGATDIFSATSRDGGRTFASPIRVNSSAGTANVSGEQPPRVVFVPRRGASPAVAVVWTAKTNAGTRIMTARSEDGGRSFGAEHTLSGSRAPGNRGWESAAADANGNGVVVWLDHRELAAPANATPAAHDHGAMKMPSHDPSSVGREQLSKLYFQRLDGSTPAAALTGGVCYCCKTSVVAGAGATFYAVWRHVYAGNMRDIAFATSRDGGRTFSAPVRVSEDKWMLDGCPENGPALTTSGRDVIVIWPTLVAASRGGESMMQLFAASTRDGKTFTPRMAMPTEGVPRHPQIAMAPGGMVVAAWDEGVNGRRQVVMSFSNTPVPHFMRRRVMADEDTAEYPAIAAGDSAVLVAWTSGTGVKSAIRVASITNP
jgi:hypothetical protein